MSPQTLPDLPLGRPLVGMGPSGRGENDGHVPEGAPVLACFDPQWPRLKCAVACFEV